MPFIPPGGFAGMAQQAPAVRNRVARAARGGNGSGRRRRRKKSAAAPRARKRRRSAGGRLKKGSPAAKARMAKLRKMRKK